MIFKKNQRYRVFIFFTCTWLLSTIANSAGEPDPFYFEEEKSQLTEYPLIKQLQTLTGEVQMLELVIKNRQDQELESRISAQMKEIEKSGVELGKNFAELRKNQMEELYALFLEARKIGTAIGVLPVQWDDLLASLRTGEVPPADVMLHTKLGPLKVLSITPLSIGKQSVWQLSLPTENATSFWRKAFRRYYGTPNPDGTFELTKSITRFERKLQKKLDRANTQFEHAQKRARDYYKLSHSKLYSAFENHRFAILSRITQAKNLLTRLSKSNTAMGTPEQFGALYNRLVEDLFSYGIDVSLTGLQRDFKLKGILFAESPEQAEELYQKLRFTGSSPKSYNSPSS